MFDKNEDIIALVESSFIGKWGEQHGGDILSDDVKKGTNVSKLVIKLLDVVPKSRTLNIRYPGNICWLINGSSDNNSINSCLNNISNLKANPTDNYYRVGIWNDGYLGSSSDLKTFYWLNSDQREAGISFLNNQATHTIYGGEATMCGGDWCKNSVYDQNNNLYYSSAHMIEEMFETHTSYLNSMWNSKVLNAWITDKYNGDEELYNNKSAYLYIQNHLGYRLVLNSTTIPKQVKQNREAQININLKNIGAGNVVNQKTTYIVLKNDTNEYAIEIPIEDMDVRQWLSRDTQNINVSVPIEKDMEPGNYDVYLKIINTGDDPSTNKRTIRFANYIVSNEEEGTNIDVWNETIGANKIGNIEIVKNIDVETIENPDTDADLKYRIITLIIGVSGLSYISLRRKSMFQKHS